jgi:hypothetical protein
VTPWLVELATSVPAVVAAAAVAVFLLYRDLVQRELDPQHVSTGQETPEADRAMPPARPVTGDYRWWGIVATAVFVVLVALRFLVLGA